MNLKNTKSSILLWGISLSLILFSGCGKQENTLRLTISNQAVSTSYIGNGVQWDAYPEAEQWGASVSEADWQKLYQRLDFMKPNFVRCLINSPFRYYNPKTGEYNKTRNIESLSKLLQYCQDNNITVLFGEYNPPTWDMKQDPAWIDMAVDYLNYLVNDLGFTCIKHYNLFNEPDGNWSATNGDYEMWKGMVLMFIQKMKAYPTLNEKVKIAAPDIVVGYRNQASPYEPYEWIEQSAKDMNPIIGIYDVHAYPGQHEVRSGQFAQSIKDYVIRIPKGKQLVLGEAGYKYYKAEDSVLMAEHVLRATNHPFTKGSDCNMLVYDFFYGLDMPLLCMDMMNAGLSGMAVWMLDDAMHSSGDAGDTTNIKLWGMWNILGEEVFGRPAEEEIRPWYYTWSLMCRYFPGGTRILETALEKSDNIRVVSGEHDGELTLAMVNIGNTDQSLTISLTRPINNARVYTYQEDFRPEDENGFPTPSATGLNAQRTHRVTLKAQSFMLITEKEY